MPEEEKTTSAESSVPVASEEEAKAKQDQILGVAKPEAKPTEEKPGETEKTVEEKEKAKAEAEAEKAKPADADEEEKLEAVLARFKDTPEKDKPKALAKAYREAEKLLGEKSSQVGELEKAVQNFKQFQADLDADPKATIKRLQDAADKQTEEDEEIVLDRQTIKKIIGEEIAQKDTDKQWFADQETVMNERHKDWGELTEKRNALKEAVRLGKFPLSDEIFHLAVRGSASPEQLLTDAKKIVKKEEADALAAKANEQTQTQAGGAPEKKDQTYQEEKEASVLTAGERAAGG